MKIIKTELNTIKHYDEFDIKELKADDVVNFDIFIKKDVQYIIIIEAGTLITQKLYDTLLKQEKLYVLKKGEDKDKVSGENLKYLIRQNRDNPEKIVAYLYEVCNELFSKFLDDKTNKIDIPFADSIVRSNIFLMKYEKKFLSSIMPYFKNDYKLANHSLHVTLYALNLGTALNFSTEDLLKLGMAALLHDVGYKNLPEEVLNKESFLDEKELELIHKHCKHGVDIIEHNKLHDPYIIDAIMHHHERYDASGYPENLHKDKISPFASIIGICDVFDALTNNRPHRKEFKSFEALSMMMKDLSMINKFNQNYLKIMLKTL